MALKPTVLTFMCISLSRCKFTVYGPALPPPRCGKHVFEQLQSCRWQQCVCIHANQKCVESVCVHQGTIDSKDAESSHAWMTFRSMLRMSDVHYPFDIHGILRKLKQSH